MSIKKIILFFLLFPILPQFGWCQIDDDLPPTFDQFFKNIYLINPAVYDTSQTASFAVGNRTLTGLFEGVSRFYADVNVLIHSRKNRTAHQLGVLAVGGKSGEYFSRNRLYLRYGYNIALSSSIAASAGFSIGLINYSTKASLASSGGSATSPDVSLGLWINSRTWNLGFSSQQLLQPRLQPVGQSYFLSRVFNYNLNNIFKLSSLVSLNSYIYVRQQLNMPLMIQIAPILVWKKIFETGVNYKIDKGLSVLVGLSSVKIYKGDVRLMASYFLNAKNLSGVNDNVIEFSLGYTFSKQ